MNARPSKATGLAFPFIFFSVFVWIVSLSAQNACAQWEPIGQFPHQISNVYFLSEFGHPEIGFVGMFPADTSYPGSLFTRDSEDLWRTSDGGKSWNPIALTPNSVGQAFNCRDFTFKDSLNGWMTSWNCYKTTDGGVTWMHITADMGGYENSIYYHPTTKLLLLSVWSHDDYDSAYVSSDEGTTWTAFGGGHNGYAFAGLNGVVTGVADPGTPALYTTDGGVTWSESNFNDECWQPACIPGTTTFFAASEKQNRISRSDDGGKTWRTIYVYGTPFDPVHNLDGCIRIDRCGNLYVMTHTEGFLMSSDEGVSWHSIGGPSAWDDARFWITSDYIYAGDGAAAFVGTECELCSPGTLWRYHLSNPGLVFSDGSKRMSLSAGSDATVNFTPTGNEMLGADSVHFLIRYDSASLILKDFNLSGGWTILDSSTHGDTLDLWAAFDSSYQIQSPNLQLTFKTVLASSSAKVYLDSAHFYGGCQTCDCPVLANGSDSVEIDFQGCGNPTILAAMEHAPPFSIESIVPNPAQSKIRITLSAPASYSLFDQLGITRLTGNLSSIPSEIDVTSLPSGSYYLRLTSNGYTITRKIQIER